LTSIICLIIWPDWLTSISFQLSFGATLGIILFGNVVPEKHSSHPEVKPKDPDILKTGFFAYAQNDKIKAMTSYLVEELRVSLSAQLFTAPLIFFYFRQISLVSPLANILVSWTIAPIMILGIISMIASMLSWYLGFMISWLCYGLIQYIIWIVEWLAKIPLASIKLV
ncbi:MAG TPA: ComEC/Rec2 family competence protein, partial [Candidatus Woesebacteria bacterium]|nr:ComEC/Rec2 family competence protein [Candidatus Woesebacteria bacterium]